MYMSEVDFIDRKSNEKSHSDNNKKIMIYVKKSEPFIFYLATIQPAI